MQIGTGLKIATLLVLTGTLLISDGCCSTEQDTKNTLPSHSKKIQQLNKHLSKLDEQLTKLTHRKKEFVATITAYHAVKEQCDDSPDITAFGNKSRPGITCAVSEKLRWEWPYIQRGDILLIRNRLCIVDDLMNARYSNEKRVDIMVPRNSRVFLWKNETVTLVQGYYDE